MTHQDDLETDYRALSDEQPSAKTDQLILQAASDALKNDNVIKHNFLSTIHNRRWNTPVSIAAAALITFSFVNYYNPSKVTEFAPVSPPPEISAEPQELKDLEDLEDQRDQTEQRERSNIISESQRFEVQSLPTAKSKMKADKAAKANEASQKKDRSTIAKISSFKLESATSIAEEQVQPSVNAVDAIEPTDVDTETLSADEDMTVIVTGTRSMQPKPADNNEAGAIANNNPALDKPSIAAAPQRTAEFKKKPHYYKIEFSLKNIELHLANNKIELAKAELDILKKQYPLQKFSKAQRARFKSVDKKITSRTAPNR